MATLRGGIGQMLACFNFSMRCERPGSFSGADGELIHGALFNIMREIDGGFASDLHRVYPKPFTIRRLRPAQPGEGASGPAGAHSCKGDLSAAGSTSRSWALQENNDYVFSVCSLSQPMYQMLREMAAVWPGRGVNLGPAGFTAVSAWEDGQSTTDYESLLGVHDLHQRKAPPKILFSFLSPTGFRRQGEQVLFPLPELVMRSLVSRWNAFAPNPWPEDLLNADEIAHSILVSHYRLRTEVVSFSRFMLLGFMGTVTYTVSHNAPQELITAILALSRYSQYAGVGYRTSMGMGRSKASLK